MYIITGKKMELLWFQKTSPKEEEKGLGHFIFFFSHNRIYDICKEKITAYFTER